MQLTGRGGPTPTLCLYPKILQALARRRTTATGNGVPSPQTPVRACRDQSSEKGPSDLGQPPRGCASFGSPSSIGQCRFCRRSALGLSGIPPSQGAVDWRKGRQDPMPKVHDGEEDENRITALSGNVQLTLTNCLSVPAGCSTQYPP